MRELMHPITMGYGSPARLGGLGAVTPLASKPGLLPLESSSPSSTQQPQQQAQQITRRLVLTDLPVDVLAVIVGFLTQEDAHNVLKTNRRLRYVVQETWHRYVFRNSPSIVHVTCLVETLPMLSEVCFDGNPLIEDAHLVPLAALRNLRELSLRRCPRVRGTVLHKFSKLVKLDIESCFSVSDCTMPHINNLPLQRLALCDLLHINGFGFSVMASLATTLTVLDLTDSHRVCDTNMHYLTVLVHLRVLLCDNLYRLTDDCLPSLARLPALRTLGLARCRHLSGDALQLLGHVRSLRQLNLAGCVRVLSHDVRDLAEKLPLAAIVAPNQPWSRDWWR